VSLILIYAELPEAPTGLRPRRLATFPVAVKVARQPRVFRGFAITDGVASDRFVAFGNNVRGREGARLRRELISFLGSRVDAARGIYLKLIFPRGAIGTVILDVNAAKPCGLRQLQRVLKGLKPGELLAVTAGVTKRGTG
jgi:hypothetical protein